MKRFLAVGVAALALALPGAVLGWGSSGHRLLGQAAMRALPAELPAFLRTPQAVVDVGEMSREPDRLKRAGRAFDSDRDQG
ncbi:MAG TPA: S1/P1 Nuclease, partial [Phenylobacterium sp.]